MSSTLQAGGQARWKNSYASAPKVGLTVQANGEESVKVYTPDGQLVPAGIAAPTVAPTVADAGSGSLGIGYVAYFYVYASSNYPFVEAITRAGGELWPKSNPSPASAVFHIATVSHNNTVTVTRTTAPGVDKILIYRTPTGSDSATAAAYAAAGQAYYVGVVANAPTGGTTTFTDNVTAYTEQLELDNYEAPQFWLVVYESPYWWGAGNPDYDIEVTLDGSTLITGGPWFSGRDGQTITFDGITAGGYDGKGSFYFKTVNSTTAQACFDTDLTNPATLPIGTTTAHIRGYSGTLYRSKPNNPFAWGWTEDQISNSGGSESIVSIPQQYAFNIGGNITALAAISTDRLLKIDTENPTRSFALNLSFAGTDGFEGTLRTLDTRFSVTSHHTQIPVALPNGQSILRGLDAKQFAIVQGGSTAQINVSGDVYRTLRELYSANDSTRLYHAIYDATTELSVFWVKLATQDEDDDDFTIDTALCFHGPSGTWTLLDDVGITASAIVFDPVRDQSLTLLGRDDGRLMLGFIGREGIRSAISAPFSGGDYTITTVTELGLIVGVNGGGPTGANKGISLAPALAEVAVGDVIRINGTIVMPETTRIVENIVGDFPNIQINWPSQAEVNDEIAGLATCDILLADITTGDVGQWLFLTDSDGRREAYGRIATIVITSSTTTTITFDRFISATSDIAPGKVSASTSDDGIYFSKFSLGQVDCRARSYFTTRSPDVARGVEAWVIAQNAQDDFWPLQLRHYPELGDQLAADSRAKCTVLSLARDTAANGSSSVQWMNKTEVPSTLLPFYALEIVQRGDGEFKLHSFDIKIR